MQRKAAIYIRTSSEAQGGKASPGKQEADCRSLAQEKYLTISMFTMILKNNMLRRNSSKHLEQGPIARGLFSMLKDVFRLFFDKMSHPPTFQVGGCDMIVYEKISCSRTQSFHYIESFMWFLKFLPPDLGAKCGMY